MDKYIQNFYLKQIELARLLIELPRILYVGPLKYKKTSNRSIPMDDGDLVPSPNDPYSEVYSALCAEINNIKSLYSNGTIDLPRWEKFLASMLEEFKLYSPNAEVNKIKYYLPYLSQASTDTNKSSTKTRSGMHKFYGALKAFSAKIKDKEVRKIIYYVVQQAKDSYNSLFMTNVLTRSKASLLKYITFPFKKVKRYIRSCISHQNILTKKDSKGVETEAVKAFKTHFMPRHHQE